MKTRKEVMETLRTILQWCELKKQLLELPSEVAIEQTLDNYDDFYDWLMEEVKDEG